MTMVARMMRTMAQISRMCLGSTASTGDWLMASMPPHSGDPAQLCSFLLTPWASPNTVRKPQVTTFSKGPDFPQLLLQDSKAGQTRGQKGPELSISLFHSSQSSDMCPSIGCSSPCNRGFRHPEPRRCFQILRPLPPPDRGRSAESSWRRDRPAPLQVFRIEPDPAAGSDPQP